MTYAAETDPQCYVGTGVLINRAGLTNQDDLDQFEIAMFLLRSEDAPPSGPLDYAHYRSIHRHLFQDVYAWAGEARTIRIGKNGNWFCFPEYIDGQMERIFGELAHENRLTGLSAAQFAQRSAHYLAEINAVHPFREGNGRTQLVLLRILAQNAGFSFNFARLEPVSMINAMIASFAGDEEPLTTIILGAISD